MRSIPLADREKMFAFLQGREAFKQCLRVCAEVLNSNMDHTHPLFTPLGIAAHVVYARPFMKSYGFGKLDEVIVPDALRPIHLRVIDRRNKIFAHRQVKQARKGGHSELLHLHHVFITVGERELFTSVAERRVEVEFFAEIAKLSDTLLPKTRHYSRELFRKYEMVIPREQGTYQLAMDDSALEIFAPVEGVELNEESFSENLPALKRE